MLLRLAMPYRVDYVPKRGRIARHDWFVDEETVEIVEAPMDEVHEAYRLIPRPAEAAFGPDNPKSVRGIVSHAGRLYWPVLDGDRPVLRGDVLESDGRAAAPTWAARLPGDALSASPDVFGLKARLHGRAWPLHRFDPDAVRSVAENGRDAAAASLHRAAARLLLAGGRLYRRGGEPVWLVRADIRRFDVVGQGVFRDAMDAMEEVASSGADKPVPFVNYEVFRADRGGDAAEFARARIASRARGYYAEGDRWRIEAAASPVADVLTPMLRGLHDCAVGLLEWGAYWTRRDRGLPQDMPASEVALRHGPDWLRRLADVVPAPERSGAVALSVWLSEVATRLEGADTRADAFGWVETVRRALRRAGERVDHDVGLGLLAAAVGDSADDDALGALGA